MLETFGATFSGVFASFLLWFGSRYLIRKQRNKKLLKAMMQEIQEELQANIAILSQFSKHIPDMLATSGHIPMTITSLELVAHQYAVTSGEIRLLSDIRKQRLIRYTASILERYNEFVDNTERLLAIFILKDDGLIWAKYRVDRQVELANDTIKLLQDTLNKLQQDKITNEIKPFETN